MPNPLPKGENVGKGAAPKPASENPDGGGGCAGGVVITTGLALVASVDSEDVSVANWPKNDTAFKSLTYDVVSLVR